MKGYDYIICGAGLAGVTAARLLAEKGNKILILERLPHIGGSVYDSTDESGILIHNYGPHIFHTNNKKVFNFLSRFTEWNGYSHKVEAKLHECNVPVPFNLKSIELVYGAEKTEKLLSLVKEEFGTDTVSVMSLVESKNTELSALGKFVYDNIFLYYTVKQWGKKPSEVDPKTTSRVPVRLSYDDRYFTDEYQGLPLVSYTSMVENMLSHSNITVELGVDALDKITLSNGDIYFNGEKTDAKVVYTGETDRLFGFIYGHLPYRTLDFKFETHNVSSYQSAATVNYTVSEDFTRITEFKKLTLQEKEGVTTIMKEYPRQYEGKDGEIPYYPVACTESAEMYGNYLKLSKEYPSLILVGRLAEYKYYNMDAVVARAMELFE